MLTRRVARSAIAVQAISDGRPNTNWTPTDLSGTSTGLDRCSMSNRVEIPLNTSKMLLVLDVGSTGAIASGTETPGMGRVSENELKAVRVTAKGVERKCQLS